MHGRLEMRRKCVWKVCRTQNIRKKYSLVGG